jgi:hypothetical protein
LWQGNYGVLAAVTSFRAAGRLLHTGTPQTCANIPAVAAAAVVCAGKTTFIKFLLGQDYPGLHIGPEPTTDR